MSYKFNFLKEKKLANKRSIFVKEFDEGTLLMTGLSFNFRRYNYKNTNKVIKAFGYTKKIAKTRQKHTNNIVIYPHEGEYVGIDGFITKDQAVMIVTADCIPLLLKAKDEVALLHAGWKGVKKRIYIKAINHFRKNGINPKDIECYMLPSISKCDFEVSGDFLDEFSNRKNFKKYLEKKEKKDKYIYDLKSLVKRDLMDLGIKKIFLEEHSTLTSDLFHSYRREGKDYGLNAIMYLPKK